MWGVKRTEITKDFLIQKYLNEDLSVKQIAEITNYCKSSIRYYLDLYNIKRKILGIDYTGQKFWKLTVEKLYELKNNERAVWECRCECGNKLLLSSTDLVIKGVKSCGCWEYIPISYQKHGKYLLQTIASARSRGLECTITSEYILDLFIKQNKKCAISGIDITINLENFRDSTASLDRIDSSKGYIEGNVQWVHREINKMKFNFSQDHFINWMVKIYNFNK